MAIRNRIIYQSQAVALSGASTAALPITINGVQSVTYGIEVGREDVNQFGALGAIDRVILEAPTATQEVSFHFPNGAVTHTILNTLITGSLGTANDGLIVALDTQEGDDFNSANETVSLVSGRLSSFSLEASVGAIPTITLGFEGTALTYGAQTISAPTSYADELTSFTGAFLSFSVTQGTSGHMAHPQSATLSFDLGSEGLQQLGINSLVYARVPTFPATATLEVEGIAVDRGMSLALAGIKAKSSESTDSDDGGRTNVSLSLGGVLFTLVNATLDSVSYSNSIGDNATCSASFGVSIGGSNSVSQLTIAAV